MLQWYSNTLKIFCQHFFKKNFKFLQKILKTLFPFILNGILMEPGVKKTQPNAVF